ncbi:MAG: FHA domain-containing protein [Variovorax sp.]|nr:MAG: FHA domain-containing protein [Variovorax sp.]
MSESTTPTLRIQPLASEHYLYKLTSPRTTFGRSPANDVMLSDIRVSRFHAAIVLQPPFALVEDVGSRNGVLLNGHAVMHAALSHGDVLTMGDCVIHVVWEGHEAQHIEAEALSSIPGWRPASVDESNETRK